MFRANLADASVVTMYLAPQALKKLEPKVLSELTVGARVITHDYELPNTKADFEFTAEHPSKKAITGEETVRLFQYTIRDPLVPYPETAEIVLPDFRFNGTAVRSVARLHLCAQPHFHPCVFVAMTAEALRNYRVFTMTRLGDSHLENIHLSVEDVNTGAVYHSGDVFGLPRDSISLDHQIVPGTRVRVSIKRADPANSFKAHRALTISARVTKFRQYGLESLEVDSHPSGLGGKFFFQVDANDVLGIWFRRFPISPSANITVRVVGGDVPFAKVIFNGELAHAPSLEGWPSAVSVSGLSDNVDLLLDATFNEFTRDYEYAYFIDNVRAFMDDLKVTPRKRKVVSRVPGPKGAIDLTLVMTLSLSGVLGLRAYSASIPLHYIQIIGYDGVHNIVFAFECLERLPVDLLFNADGAFCAAVGLDKLTTDAVVRGNLMTISVMFNVHSEESAAVDPFQTEFVSLGGALQDVDRDEIPAQTLILSVPVSSIIHAQHVPKPGDDVFDALAQLPRKGTLDHLSLQLVRLSLMCLPAYAVHLPTGDKSHIIAAVHLSTGFEVALPFQLAESGDAPFHTFTADTQEAARAQHIFFAAAYEALSEDIDWFQTIFKDLSTFEEHLARVSRKTMIIRNAEDGRLFPVIVPYLMPLHTAVSENANAVLRTVHEVVQLQTIKRMTKDDFNSFVRRTAPSSVTVKCEIPRILSHLLYGAEDVNCKATPLK